MNNTEETSLISEAISIKSKRGLDERVSKYLIGTKVFMTCLFFLLIIYVADIILSVGGLDKSELTVEILEIVKTLLFTICGYLFGRAELSETQK